VRQTEKHGNSENHCQRIRQRSPGHPAFRPVCRRGSVAAARRPAAKEPPKAAGKSTLFKADPTYSTFPASVGFR